MEIGHYGLESGNHCPGLHRNQLCNIWLCYKTQLRHSNRVTWVGPLSLSELGSANVGATPQGTQAATAFRKH